MTRPLRVFLCHASQDKPTVWKLYRYLKQRGVKPWLDQVDLLPGEDWEVEIPNALFSSDVILVCLSKNSVDKEGYVQKEISFALDKALEKPGRIFIIPVKLEECDIPKRLSRYQWVDLSHVDGRKRLLMGLNKRVTELDSDVLPVILEDTRQKKSTTKPVSSDLSNSDVVEASLEMAEKEAIEKALLENAARETAEKAKLERLVLEAKLKTERESAENVRREKLEHEAMEKATIESLELEAKEKSKDEAAERKVREKRKRELRELKEKEMSDVWRVFVSSIFNLVFSNLRLFGVGGVILFFLFFVVFGLNYLINNLPIATFPNSSRTVATATNSSPKATETIKPPTLTSVPFTPTPQPTEISQPVSTPAPGSTMIGEKDETLVYVPAGEFTMGSDTGSSDEQPIHTVYLDAFWIDQTEVTNKQYKACVDAGTCEPPSSESSYTHPNYYGNPEFDNFPVINVNWDKANRYCEVWTGGDLPTEAQWEKSARGTDARTYPWGNDAASKDLLNYNGDIGDTTMVKNYPNTVSVYGTYDMAGNVWEWVNDWYDETYYKNSNLSKNPLGPESGDSRVLRGGSWVNYGNGVRSADRIWNDQTVSSDVLGFRCSRSP
ncbi:MAG: SUMF1/EgtB/PvdO family nonheme iron enzyme [Anaerolineales bacterium]|nr:SUMF1/EgtB/PvdO family nonheme iron enzyme [Anaerolineales bacterium]